MNGLLNGIAVVSILYLLLVTVLLGCIALIAKPHIGLTPPSKATPVVSESIHSQCLYESNADAQQCAGWFTLSVMTSAWRP